MADSWSWTPIALVTSQSAAPDIMTQEVNIRRCSGSLVAQVPSCDAMQVVAGGEGPVCRLNCMRRHQGYIACVGRGCASHFRAGKDLSYSGISECFASREARKYISVCFADWHARKYIRVFHMQMHKEVYLNLHTERSISISYTEEQWSISISHTDKQGHILILHNDKQGNISQHVLYADPKGSISA